MIHLPCNTQDSAEVSGVLIYTPHSSRIQLKIQVKSIVKQYDGKIP